MSRIGSSSREWRPRPQFEEWLKYEATGQTATTMPYQRVLWALHGTFNILKTIVAPQRHGLFWYLVRGEMMLSICLAAFVIRFPVSLLFPTDLANRQLLPTAS
jgi:hypothetical protein